MIPYRKCQFRGAIAVHMFTLKEILREYWEDRPTELAAALSYYTLLSLAPLVLLTVALAELVFEQVAVEGRIVTEMRGLVGEEGASVVQTVLGNAHNPEKGRLSVVISIVLLLIGATTVFAQLQNALNRIWKVHVTSGKSAVWSVVKERLLSVAMVLAVGFLLLVSLLVSATLSAIDDSVLAPVSASPTTLLVLQALVSLVVSTFLFAMIFKILPDAQVTWPDVWFGATTTSVLFTLGKSFIGLYLGRTAVGSAYGAAGSLVVLTVWVYYAAMIVFFGAKLTYIRSKRRRGDPRDPTEAGFG